MIIIYNIFPSLFFFFFFFFSNHRLGYKFKVLKSKTILKKLLFINGYSASRMKVTLDWPISNYEKYSWEQISRLFTLQMYSLNSIYIYMLSSFSPISQQTEENKKQIGKVVIYRVRNFIIIVFEFLYTIYSNNTRWTGDSNLLKRSNPSFTCNFFVTQYAQMCKKKNRKVYAHIWRRCIVT